MQAIANFSLISLLDTLVSLTAAFILGSLIGLERQYRQRTAGLRTNALVAVGAAIFVDIAYNLNGAGSAAHVIAYVVSGVGFLGAGVIMREQGNVRGINTAATLWGSAAIGASAGADLIMEAILGTVFVLAANTLLRPIVNRINRQPLDVEGTEMTHILYVIAPKPQQKHAMDVVELVLEAAELPSRSLDITPFGDDDIEITATLSAMSIDGSELERISKKLLQKGFITQAYWSTSTQG
ncbi:MgtC/SapB family protein [Alkalimonas collagenimarina]|uniref:Protein MgtC n=1 Tax=Alkalimonas collagenimarina TaxID=400390 RepID=A0ABT9GYM8_9GAMM|nr:MgtC/SapB family protein [Alkalimonas collagenimarina]MDP4535795.1 MgtC/SapB family protein [Alkalimonas collagenimarina]